MRTTASVFLILASMSVGSTAMAGGVDWAVPLAQASEALARAAAGDTNAISEYTDEVNHQIMEKLQENTACMQQNPQNWRTVCH
jgi:hypothetical protein